MKKILKSKSGVTLAELLVTFAVFAIMLSCAMVIISSSSNVFLRIKYLSYANSVGDMIIERVGGEISSSVGEVVIDTSGDKISFIDSTGSPVYIGVTSGNKLLIHYREVRVVEGDIITEVVLWPAVDWEYDEKAYQGFLIESLEFNKINNTKAVEISMVLQMPFSDYKYKSKKTVECYNVYQDENVNIGTVYISDDDYYNNKR